MPPVFQSIRIADFRSIRGDITVPLDAPVVLIHGQNGAGKTSLLSALELALTGQVPSLRRIDPGYFRHLVHKQAQTSTIALSGQGLSRTDTTIAIDKNGKISGSPLLSPSEARFFSERCFLAQSTLGRLLELYEHTDDRDTDSPLTRFVKDLLGLDHLDALVEGLHDAGDVRRVRNAVPSYADVRSSLAPIQARLSTKRKEAEALTARGLELSGELARLFSSLELPIEPAAGAAALRAERPEAIEIALQGFARARRDLTALEEQWRARESAEASQDRVNAESALNDATIRFERWRSDAEPLVDRFFADVAAAFPDLPKPSIGNLERARLVAEAAVARELSRCVDVIQREEADAKKIEMLDDEILRARSRLTALERQISEQVADSGARAEALSHMVSHVHGDVCPVCGRDFSEVSASPLQAHLSTQIAALTESAGRLQTMARERAADSSVLAVSEREREVVASRRLAATERDRTKTRRAQMLELQAVAGTVASAAVDGDASHHALSEAMRRLGDRRPDDQVLSSLRDAVASLAANFVGLSLPADAPLDEVLSQVRLALAMQEDVATRRLRDYTGAVAFLADLDGVESRLVSIGKEISSDEAEIARLTGAQRAADNRITDARELARRAREARTSVVRRVFNTSLNSIWRDLFVRLAPEEQFVPAFALPTDPTSAVEAILETHYRSGGTGGNPRAMLSSGNLNTAALTLFLALHLSVEPTLPCLIIDDPIQSMDEVHIAQFAALLRTLSKRLARQVIVAVHEKPLFDYLALELSPAFQFDRLVTLELGRNADGASTLRYEPHVWQPDAAIPA